MTLEKAIEIKEENYNGGVIPSLSDYREADRLSIEAQKRYKEQREADCWIGPYLLEGETED